MQAQPLFLLTLDCAGQRAKSLLLLREALPQCRHLGKCLLQPPIRHLIMLMLPRLLLLQLLPMALDIGL
jgi:hypothetical protein